MYNRASRSIAGNGGTNYSHTIKSIASGSTVTANVTTLNGFAVICNNSQNLEFNVNTRNWAVIGNGAILDSYSYNSNASIGYNSTSHKVTATNNVTGSASLYLHVWTIN